MTEPDMTQSASAGPAHPATEAHSLLDDPLIGIRDETGTRFASLPEILHALSTGAFLEFTSVRPYQQHPWRALLVQLGALSAHWQDRPVADFSRDAWRTALIELAGSEEAWQLVVEDLDKPAFMQPPVPEGTLEGFRAVSSPDDDALDVLVKSKNHDQKRHQLMVPRPEHWVYALVMLQTMEGYSGSRNYGIARMNGGYGSRSGVGLAPSLSWADRFRRDVHVWLEIRDRLVAEYGYPDEQGHALLWTLPWDGQASLSLRSCDPFFIEICRRIRLQADRSGQLQGWVTNTRTSRLDAKKQRGDTGDIWVPVSADGRALNVKRSGFSYRLLADLLLSEDYPQRPALRPQPEDGSEPILVAQVLARDQGKTAGYHERLLPIPESVKLKLGSSEERARLGELAQARVEQAWNAQRRVLHPALCVLLQGGPEQGEAVLNDDRTHPWLDRLDRRIDQVFFEDLWADVDRSDEEARWHWHRRLWELARAELEDATESAPIPRSQQPRAVARAELTFGGLARRHLDAAFNDQTEETAEQEEQ